MRTPAQIARHPIHPMLVTIPIGLWLFSLACDVIALGSDAPESWATASLYAMVGGILGALAAAIPGMIDAASLRGRPIRSTAIKHGALNLTVLALFVVNAWMRWDDPVAGATGFPFILSLVAIALLAVSGWLGGKMVYEAGVAVHTEDLLPEARSERWDSDRAGAARRPATGAGLRSDHAFASDAARDREARRDDRPAAGRSGDSPRE